MQNVLLEDKIVVSLQVDKNIFPNSIEAEDDITIGDKYVKGKWIRLIPRPEPPKYTNSELRYYSYLNERYKKDGITPLIVYNNKNLTIEECRIELDFYIYDNDNGNAVRNILVPQYNKAKEYWREVYPIV